MVLIVGLILGTACTAEEEKDEAASPSPSVAAATPGREAGARAQVYAAVIHELLTKDNTFGKGSSPFKAIYIVDGPIKGAGNPRVDIFGPAPRSFPSAVMEGIRQLLPNLHQITFIGNANRVRRGPQGMIGVKNDGVIIALGPIERRKGRVLVPNALWCGGLCAQWQTYVVREVDGQWKVTGTSGPLVIS